MQKPPLVEVYQSLQNLLHHPLDLLLVQPPQPSLAFRRLVLRLFPSEAESVSVVRHVCQTGSPVQYPRERSAGDERGDDRDTVVVGR
jgi:hypothetical protein